MEKNEGLLEKLRKKKHQTLVAEEKEVLDRQKFIRTKIDVLRQTKDDLQEDRYKAQQAGNTATVELLNQQISDKTSEIAGLLKEYETYQKAIESYGKVKKEKGELKNGFLGTMFKGAGIGASVWLGCESLKRAYDSDIKGTLVNKKTLEVFKALNPLRLIDVFKMK